MAVTTHEQVLEFDVAGQRYCVSIEHVTEIVDAGEITPVPNAPPYLEGVMDLRGETTAMVDPREVFGLSGGDPDRIVVYEPSVAGDQPAGWLVGGVEQVLRAAPEEIDEPTEDDPAVRGLLQDEAGYLVRIDPRAVHAA